MQASKGRDGTPKPVHSLLAFNFCLPCLCLQVEHCVWVPRAAIPSGPSAHRLLALAQVARSIPRAVPGAAGTSGGAALAQRGALRWRRLAAAAALEGIRHSPLIQQKPNQPRSCACDLKSSEPWPFLHSISVQIGYEPYIMMHRDFVPFYDERFRGYYW